MTDIHITYAELQKAVRLSKDIFKQLQQKYPELDGYLVFSRFGPGSGQSDHTDDVFKVLGEFPGMIEDSNAKTINIDAMLKLNGVLRDRKADSKAKMQAIEKYKPSQLSMLRFHSDILVEIRFNQLRYSLIHALQSDPLVSHNHDVSHSIRVVLGNFKELIEID
ncbi:MAG: hypothetical protein PF904_21745 [Kiritimatiellae bacterium]|jgi:hypothetical protein|nr:hypothetical protein [Kiritimatiellia bacterium]